MSSPIFVLRFCFLYFFMLHIQWFSFYSLLKLCLKGKRNDYIFSRCFATQTQSYFKKEM